MVLHTGLLVKRTTNSNINYWQFATSGLMSNIWVSLVATCMENTQRLAELSNCADSVHSHIVYGYQHFVNAFVYANNCHGRQDAVRKAQEFWKVQSDEKKDSIVKEAFRKL
jgi:hypothetical protein